VSPRLYNFYYFLHAFYEYSILHTRFDKMTDISMAITINPHPYYYQGCLFASLAVTYYETYGDL